MTSKPNLPKRRPSGPPSEVPATLEAKAAAAAAAARADATQHQPSAVAAATSGVVAAGAALATAELVSGISTRVPSLLVAIFDVLVDYSPSGVVAWSRETFGLNQKTVTITGIVVVALVLGAGFGVASLRNRRVGPAGFAIFGLFGGWAAARSPLHGAGWGWLIAIIAVAAGVGVLMTLLRSLPFAASDVPFPERLTSTSERRRFLAVGGAAALWGVIAGGLGRQFRRRQSVEASRDAVANRIATRSEIPGGSTSTVTAAPTTVFETFDDVVDGITPIYSPNDNFYRIDTAFTPPLVDVDTWTLTIKGMVDNEVTLTFDDILAMDSIEEIITLSCVSNPVGGHLVGNATWTGVPLPALLDLAGVRPEATQIVGRSVDDFTAGFRTEIAYDGRPAMLAYLQNGEPLPVQHGFPARLVVPGLYGYVSATKWIKEIELTTWEDFDGYWITRNWSKEGPIKTQSRIDVPRAGEIVGAGKQAIAGVAWAGLRSISAVEIQINDGEWQPAALSAALSQSSWVQWMVEWDAEPGDYAIKVRATDGEGNTQTADLSKVDPNGATGRHTIGVRVT